jgi:hypothetical protein
LAKSKHLGIVLLRRFPNKRLGVFPGRFSFFASKWPKESGQKKSRSKTKVSRPPAKLLAVCAGWELLH